MKYDNVKFDEEGKQKIIEGVNLIADAVEKTYGPNGKNVCIKYPSGIKITKDGATVASAVNDPDPYVSMGIDIMRDISVKTAQTVGDGSTTSIVLARALINQFKDNKNPIELSRQLNKDCRNVIDWLKQYKKEILTKEDLVKVATLSANNDSHLGNLIAEAFDKVGKEGIVQFTTSDDVDDRVEYTEGFKIESGFSSQYFVNTFKGTCELSDVMIYISDTKLSEVKKIQEIAGRALVEKKSLLLIAPDFDSEIIVFLAKNLYDKEGNDKLKSCTVKSPDTRTYREMLIEDLRILIGEDMCCDKVIVTADDTTFIGCNSNKEKLTDRIDSIRTIVKENALSEREMEFHKKRLANFTSGIATIYVGGNSEVEIKEKKDRVEDAVMATQAALSTGILPGSGSIWRIPKDVAGNLYSVLQIPFQILSNNQELCTDNTFWNGYNFKNNKYGDLYKMGIIEPFSVTTNSILNAVSTASLILTCDCLILKN